MMRPHHTNEQYQYNLSVSQSTEAEKNKRINKVLKKIRETEGV